jgi:Ni,Fe-hydrogenase III small subunit/Pyruvate/2-oxoacid:ferredoxin oxidoreductase delta subunit
MPLWTFFGLQKGTATTEWPGEESGDGQEGMFGMPRFDATMCDSGCQECAKVCPTSAIEVDIDHFGKSRVTVDYGRCVVCQLCVEACPTAAATTSQDWAVGVRDRVDLVANGSGYHISRTHKRIESRDGFRRSLHIRHVDAGSCNGCESEIQALNNPFYNLHRLGIFFTPTPRAADLLMVTGPVTYAMRVPLLQAYQAMPEPRWVMAVGTCAVSGGVAGGGYACGTGLEGVIPVDVYLPGCPPNPAAIIEALLMFLERKPQRMKGGHIVE